MGSASNFPMQLQLLPVRFACDIPHSKLNQVFEGINYLLDADFDEEFLDQVEKKLGLFGEQIGCLHRDILVSKIEGAENIYLRLEDEYYWGHEGGDLSGRYISITRNYHSGSGAPLRSTGKTTFTNFLD